MNKLMKKGVITTMAAAMFFGLFGGVAQVDAKCTDWHQDKILKTYCSTPICNYAGGGIPYRYMDIRDKKTCVTEMTGESSVKYQTRTINDGCC